MIGVFSVMKHPLTRLVVVGCLSFGVLAPTSLLYVCIAVAGYLALTLTAGLPSAGLFKRLRSSVVFLFVIVATNAFSRSGSVILEFDGLYLTQEGITRGFDQSFRLIAVLWGAYYLLSSTRIEDILDVAAGWTRRKGRPLIAAGTIALHYMPVLIESAQRMAIARRARGETDSHGFLNGITRAARSALPLFASALRNADALAEAMEARCFEPSSARSPYRVIPIPFRDASITLLVLCVTAAGLAGFL